MKRISLLSVLSSKPEVSRKLAVTTLAVMSTIIIIDLLTTRQILPYSNTSEDILFVTTMVIISIGSFILLAYTKRVIREIYTRSTFIKAIFISVVLTSILVLVFCGSCFFQISSIVGITLACATTRFIIPSLMLLVQYLPPLF
jgi:hypothetical protein